MRPKTGSSKLLSITRSKAKMLEYSIPEDNQIRINQDPAELLTLTVGLLGDFASSLCHGKVSQQKFADLKSNILFSAHYFDSYQQAKLNVELTPYLTVLGSAAFYLCDLPGSSMVLANRFEYDYPDLEGNGLENLLLWLLQSKYETYFGGAEGHFSSQVDDLYLSLQSYLLNGLRIENAYHSLHVLREAVYAIGTPRQLLLADVCSAVAFCKMTNSCWSALPTYSGLPINTWLPALSKPTFIKEFWPAQHLMGKSGVLRGRSSVIQMPTSAGKTKATELILRSAFLSGRTQLSVIVAPFKALCNEIKTSLALSFLGEGISIDEPSDAIQVDFDVNSFIYQPQILVVTPEKLLYMLRHYPSLADSIKLIVFDEGHQFDSGKRGITYELLLTSLRSNLSNDCQQILISAVISNAASVSEWLTNEQLVVDGQNLLPTYRSIGFASFQDSRGFNAKNGLVKFVDPKFPEVESFFVPHAITPVVLERKKGESLTKRKFFPDVKDGKDIALYLGLKVITNGAVAIFCGRKDTASGLCEHIAERFSRNLAILPPSQYSDKDELIKLKNLIKNNLGSQSSYYFSAQLGVFPHHGNIPQGIRLAVEEAMRNNLIQFVICTSTLAQGVNLPIRYLIVTSVYQGSERIKVRDFHNLIGRAGRAGMHTEGSILFADPEIYDNPHQGYNSWRWEGIQNLLNPENSEPCVSNLLSIFDPIISDDEKSYIPMDALDFAKVYIEEPSQIDELSQNILNVSSNTGFSKQGIEKQISLKMNLIVALESFLLSHLDDSELAFGTNAVSLLAQNTLAYHLATEPQRANIISLFNLLANNIKKTVSSPEQRKNYGTTLFGLRDTQQIEKWLITNISDLNNSSGDLETLEIVWPLFEKLIPNGIFPKFNNSVALKELVQGWLAGKNFADLYETINKHGTRLSWGSKYRKIKIDHIVEVCENSMAYDGSLIVGAISTFVQGSLAVSKSKLLHNHLQTFQKQLKYGLPSELTITLYELGFADRIICQDLANRLQWTFPDKSSVLSLLNHQQVLAQAVLKQYPSYYFKKLNELIN